MNYEKNVSIKHKTNTREPSKVNRNEEYNQNNFKKNVSAQQDYDPMFLTFKCNHRYTILIKQCVCVEREREGEKERYR